MTEELARYEHESQRSQIAPMRAEWTIEALERIAERFARSGFFDVRDKDQAFAIVMMAHALGMHPAQAFGVFHVVKGRPTMSAQAMLALFLSRGGKVKWHETTARRAKATFTRWDGTTSITFEVTPEDAKRENLLNKDNWKRFPADMLRWMLVRKAIRIVAPDLVLGLYTPEEIEMIAETGAEAGPEFTGEAMVEEEVQEGEVREAESESEPNKAQVQQALDAQDLRKLLPLDPEKFREYMRTLAVRYYREGFRFQNRAGAIGLVAQAIEGVFGGGPMAVEARHIVTWWLYGKESLKGLRDHSLKALLDVLYDEESGLVPPEVQEQFQLVYDRAVQELTPKESQEEAEA